jgi:signal transduction histidine kinase
MKILFFSRAENPGRFAFHSYYVLQNLKTVRTVSLIFLIFIVAMRIIFSVYDLPGHHIGHIDDFNRANWLALATTPLFYIASSIILKKFSRTPRVLLVAQSLALLFALCIVLSTMRASFISMYNPRNSLVMYMLGLIIISVFFTFEYYETLFIAIITEATFAILLPHYQHGINELTLNNLASLILLVSFYCISRYVFSYRADNFFKLRAIEEKNLEIETASIVKDEILGVVAHDLRNPLSIIKSAASLMEMEEGMSEDMYNYIQMINLSYEKANAIIKDLIETVQNEYHQELELADTNINKFLSGIVTEWTKSKKANVDIRYCDASHSIHANIQSEKMQRVMDNLISNALKFSKENSCIEIKLSDSADSVFISVKDFGIGIPADYLPHIFERFPKGRRNGLRGEESIGLGLSIVRQIVKKHNGDIEVESRENRGTIFTITLPKVTVAKAVVLHPSA